MKPPRSDLELRKATSADLDWLLELRLATMQGYFEQSGQSLSIEEQRRRVLQAFSEIRIIRSGGENIGMIKVVREADIWHLVQIQLAPEHQGRGLGTTLIERLLAAAREADVPVSLQVLKVNPAKRLYERLGFRVVADHGHSYEMQA